MPVSRPGCVTPVRSPGTNEDGSTTVDPDGPWLSWSVDNDVNGRIVHEWTPDGNAFTGSVGDAPGDAVGYDRGYSYDSLGRLVKAEDRSAATTGVDVTDPAQVPGCVTRSYGFDRNDNRLTKSTAGPASDGSCTAAGATATNRAFDSADRPVTGANGSGNYTYDLLGRTTTLPASDAPKPADGNVTLGYYDDDLPRSIAQAGTTTTFTLDALDRRSLETVTTSTGSTATVRHYTDTSDNPTWATTGTETTRYAELIGGDLALTVDQSGSADLTINNPHGDVVSTVDLPTSSQPATSLNGWSSYDEYGNPSAGNSTSTGTLDYGWLGAKQRATSGAGLILMGARLYNAATGLFTATDPQPGGGANAYAYPTDPVNSFDLDGNKWGWLKKVAQVAGVVAAVACVVGTAGLCLGAAIAAASASVAWHSYNAATGGETWKHAAWQAGLDIVTTRFRAARWGGAGRFFKIRKLSKWRNHARSIRKYGSHRAPWKHRLSLRRHAKHWVHSWRRHPYSTSFWTGANASLGYKSYRDRDWRGW